MGFIASQERYDATENGGRYRRRVLRTLRIATRHLVAQAMRRLAAERFEFAAFNDAHRLQLRRGLVARHTLPFALVANALPGTDSKDADYLTVLLLGHTLALTHLDYHLDGSTPNPDQDATAFKLDPHVAGAYALRCVYRASSIGATLPHGSQIVADILDPVSGFVLERMLQDHLERYALPRRDTPAPTVREYLESPTSRVLASGYWEVMTRGAYVARETEVPDDTVAFISKLRRLRQVVDELSDVEEDMRAGLLTLPILIALDQDADAVQPLLTHCWSTGSPSQDAVRSATRAVRESGALDEVFGIAETLWRDANRIVVECGSDGTRALQILVDLKFAKACDVRERLESESARDAVLSSKVTRFI